MYNVCTTFQKINSDIILMEQRNITRLTASVIIVAFLLTSCHKHDDPAPLYKDDQPGCVHANWEGHLGVK